jgi:hypothetical protein
MYVDIGGRKIFPVFVLVVIIIALAVFAKRNGVTHKTAN